MSFKVLLICEDPNQTKLYSDLITEISDSAIDVLSRLESPLDWATRGRHYHLVVIDDLGADGLFLLDRIKRLSPQTGVVVISGESASIEEAVLAVRTGAEDYLHKPVQVDKFQLAVRRCLDQKAIFGEGSAQASGYMHLISSCQMLSASMEQTRAFAIVMSYFARQLKTEHVAIYKIENQLPSCIDHFQDHQKKRDQAMEEVLEIAIHASNPFQPMLESGEYFRFIDKSQILPSLFVFRFKFGAAADKEFFCVCLTPQKPESMDTFTDCLGLLRSQAELTGKNVESYQSAQRLAYVDDATGLFNTRYLYTVLDREISVAKASQQSFAVLFIDADHFKQVNDQHGHLIGTRLLNELGHHLKEQLRESDTVIRYGGDEFVVILSPCDLSTAKAVAERIRHSVEKKSFIKENGVDVRFTVSIGVALFPLHADSKKAIIDAADQAMYKAKKGKKNSVVIGLE